MQRRGRRRRRWHARGDADSLSAFTVTVARGAPSKATVSVVGASERAWSFGIGWVQGMYYPPFVDEARLAWLQRAVRLRPDDVVIVTYAKCGTTWAEQVVLLLLARGDLGRLDPLHKNAASSTPDGKRVWWLASATSATPTGYTTPMAHGCTAASRGCRVYSSSAATGSTR